MVVDAGSTPQSGAGAAGSPVAYTAITKAHRDALLTAADLEQRSRTLGPGWRVGDNGRSLVCPAGKPLRAGAIRPYETGGLGLRLRGTNRNCSACPLRANCSKSQTPRFRKEVWLHVPPETVATVLPRGLQLQPVQSPRHTSARSKHPRDPTALPWKPPSPSRAGDIQTESAPLIPTELSRLWREAYRDIVTSVSVKVPRQTQRRRRSWLAHEVFVALSGTSRDLPG